MKGGDTLNVQDITGRIRELSLQKGRIEKEMEQLKGEFQPFAAERGIESFATGDKWYNRHWQSKPVLNTQKAAGLLEQKKLESDHAKSLQWDEQKLKAMVTIGILTQVELDACYDDGGHAIWRFDNKPKEAKEITQ